MSTKFAAEGALRPPPVSRDYTTHVFASPHGLDLSVRVWLPAGTAGLTGAPLAPWLFWVHGGGWSAGSHFAPQAWMLPLLHARGIAVVTCAYRLSPHATQRDALDDLRAGYAFCRACASELGLSADEVAIGGDSAGATMATLLALELPARVVLDVYGPVDFVALDAAGAREDLSPPRPIEHFGYPESAVQAAFKTARIEDSVAFAPFEWELQHVSAAEYARQYNLGDRFVYTDRMRLQTALKQYLGPRKLAWRAPLGIVGIDGEARQQALRSNSPVHLVDARYPPTAFLHGYADRAVPIEQSQAFAAKLRQAGRPVLESYEQDAPHAFDQVYTGPEVDGWNTVIVPVADFIAKHIRA